jgi:hypothetical protein
LILGWMTEAWTIRDELVAIQTALKPHRRADVAAIHDRVRAEAAQHRQVVDQKIREFAGLR